MVKKEDDAPPHPATQIEPAATMKVPVPKPPAGTTPRRAPGQKEVIPFVWKVCGYSFDGQTLTLFKATELADAEGQLDRLVAEGYYDGLKIYGLDEKVPPSPLAKRAKAAAARKALKVGSRGSAPGGSTTGRSAARGPKAGRVAEKAGSAKVQKQRDKAAASRRTSTKTTKPKAATRKKTAATKTTGKSAGAGPQKKMAARGKSTKGKPAPRKTTRPQSG